MAVGVRARRTQATFSSPATVHLIPCTSLLLGVIGEEVKLSLR